MTIERFELQGHPVATAARKSSVSDPWHLIDANGDTVDVVRSHNLPEFLTVGQHCDLIAEEIELDPREVMAR